MLDLGLEGTHVLISGANGGIGLPTVKLFLEQGAFVTAHVNSTSAAIDNDPELDAYRTKDNRNLCVVAAEVTSEDAVATLFTEAENQIGRPVNILVVNHAIYESKPSPIASMTLEQFKRTIDINLTGSFLLLRSYLSRLSAISTSPSSPIRSQTLDPASIILIGSTASLFGEANHADYAASKSGLIQGLMLSVKNEIVKIAPRGRVNVVAPGWVGTKMAEESLKDGDVKYQALASTPLKKIATPLDVAHQILILASTKISGHVTGQIVNVHGGMEGRLLNKREDVL